jgi:hypothetical protein
MSLKNSKDQDNSSRIIGVILPEVTAHEMSSLEMLDWNESLPLDDQLLNGTYILPASNVKGYTLWGVPLGGTYER